jgi:hypothetical protein
MARPTKQGVDYFPLDVHMDDKFKFIEIRFKLEGFAIVIKLMQRVYSNGYWCKWSEDEQLLFCDETRFDPVLLHEIFLECLKRGIFDESMFLNYNILTSKGIQKRYKEMVRRRKDVEWITDYLLIDINNEVIDDINPALSKQDDSKSTQSKVNKTKQNKTKKENTKIPKMQCAEFVSLTEEEYHKLISEHGEQKVKEMIRVLDNYKGANNKKYASDYRAILNWVVERVNGQVKGRNNGTNQQNKVKDEYIESLGF